MTATARKQRPSEPSSAAPLARATTPDASAARAEARHGRRERLAPLARRGRVSTLLAMRPQAAMRVSRPDDSAEREAVDVARQIVRMPAPVPRLHAPDQLARAAERRSAPDQDVDSPGEQRRATTAMVRPALFRHTADRGLPVFAADVAGQVQRAADGIPGPARAGLNSSTVLRRGSRSGPLLTAALARAGTTADERDVAPEVEAELAQATASGSPLEPAVRADMDPRFGADFGPVRVHRDERAGRLAARLRARAFTIGPHVFFGRGEYRPAQQDGAELIAHELTHTIQQGAARPRPETAAAARASTADGPRVATTKGRGPSARSVDRSAAAATANPMVQREEAWYERAGNAIGGAVESVVDFGESMGWDLLNRFAPELVPIIRQGPLDWLKEKISDAMDSLFETLASPVQSLTGIASGLTGHFDRLVDWVRTAAARIAAGDCGAISEAVDKIQAVFEGLAAPIIDRIKELAGQARDFFSGLWDRFGAPVWEFLQRIGGAAWQAIKDFGSWIWDKTAPIRRVAARAWSWIKDQLGIGEGPEGQNGILQWVQDKARQVWDDYIKPFYERFRTPILVAVGVLVMLSPVGPIIAIGAVVGGLAVAIRRIRQFLSDREQIVAQRGVLQGVVIPAIMDGINRVSAFLIDTASTITGALTSIVGQLNEALGAVAGSILDFAVSVLRWLVERFQELVNWAEGALLDLALTVETTLEQMRVFLQPVLDVLAEIAEVIRDVMRLPMLLAGRLWNLIPACIRDPFVNYFIPLMLRQISFFRELAATPEAWNETRAQVMDLIRGVFETFDLLGAIRIAFRIVVRALRIPVELMGQLLEKAADAWEAVIAAPLRFIESALQSMLQGVGGFITNILSHLGYGVQGWLFNAVNRGGAGRGISVAPPASWTDPREVFNYALGVLGISVDHVIELIDRRVPGAGRVLSTGRQLLTGALEWIRIAIDEGPSGLWRHIMDRLSGIGTMVLESAVSWVMTRIIAIIGARLTALAASAGVSAVLEAIKAVYDAIKTAIEYMPRILQILIRVFDTVGQIAAGMIGPAAAMVEGGLRMAMPVAIGFLANYAGVGGIGERIAEIIGDIRERIDNAILWLIDRAIALIRSTVDLIRRGVQAGVPQDPAERLRLAGRAAVTAARRLTGRVTAALLNPVLAVIRQRYGLTRLEPFERDGGWWVRAVINPTEETALGVSTGAAATGAAWWRTRTPVDGGREHHTLYFAGEPPNTVLTIATIPVPWETYVNSLVPYPSPAAATAKNEAILAAQTLEATSARPEASFAPPLTKTQAVERDMNALAVAVGRAIRLGPQPGQTVAGGGVAPPSTNTYPGTLHNPRTRTVDQLWTDLLPTPLPPSNAVGARAETATDREFRVVMARGILLDHPTYAGARPIVQAMIDHNLGRSRRDVEIAANDAAAGGLGAHTVRMHVLEGSGEIPDTQALALRAALDQPTTGGGFIAGAYNSVSAANTAIRAGLNAHRTRAGGWPKFRNNIINAGGGSPTNEDVPGAGAATVWQNRRNSRVPIPELPSYLAGHTHDGLSLAAAAGSRPLYTGDPHPGLSGQPLAVRGPNTGQIRIVLRLNAGQPQGWFVYTAYPR